MLILHIEANSFPELIAMAAQQLGARVNGVTAPVPPSPAQADVTAQPEPAPEPVKRRRKTAATGEPASQPDSSASQQPAAPVSSTGSANADAGSPAAAGMSDDDFKAALKPFCVGASIAKVVELQKEYGVSVYRDVPPAKRPEFLEKVRQAVAGA